MGGAGAHSDAHRADIRTHSPHTYSPHTRRPHTQPLLTGALRADRDGQPQAGDEYIFHKRPSDPRHGSAPMSMGKLREWYVKMLKCAQDDGTVSSFEDIQEHVEHLTSIRTPSRTLPHCARDHTARCHTHTHTPPGQPSGWELSL